MKTITRIANVSGLAIASLVLVAGPASASDYAYRNSRHETVYDYAKVVSVTPVIRYVTVTTPVKECWDDVENYTRRNPDAGLAGRTLFGAIVGGVIGHGISHGHHRDAVTVAGTAIGAAIANGTGRRRSYETTEYSRPVRRCDTNYQSHQEERVDGYDVIYRYNGQKYSTRMPYDPGRKLRIQVDVRPAA